MTIGEVPKVRILNISKDKKQKLIFSWFADGGGKAGCEGGYEAEPLSPRPPIKQRDGNLKL